MSWQEKEMLRREVLPYPLADRAAVMPFGPQRMDGAGRVAFHDEWKTQRRAVQIAALHLEMVADVWDFQPDPVNETDAGTYYTNWVDFTDGPRATGLFSCPESSLQLTPAGLDGCSVFLELYDEDGDTTSILIAALVADGVATRTGAGQVLFSLTSNKQITKGRYKVETDCAVVFTPSGYYLVSYGSP